MVKSRLVCLVISLVLLMTMFGGLAGLPALAQEKPAAETLELESKFPVLTGESGDVFEAEVDINYQGAERKRFDLSLSVPQDWRAYAESSYPKKQIAALELGPAPGYPVTEKIIVTFGPVYWNLPDPGEYVVTLEVSSGSLKASIDLTAKVTAKYDFDMTTETGRLNAKATAGKEERFAIKLVNLGSAVIEDITFSASKPEGWIIKFEPEKVESLDAGMAKDVDVIIEPPKGKTIAGDYVITLNASSKKVSDRMEVRVTVLTPSIWGWVAIIIIVLVIAGLGVIFWRLGRR